jgi:hypothetical protein
MPTIEQVSATMTGSVRENEGVIRVAPPPCPRPDRLTADERARLFLVGRTGLVQCQYRGDTARSPRPRARLVTWRAAWERRFVSCTAEIIT